MFGSKKWDGVFAGHALGHNTHTGVFRTVAVVGLGNVSMMDRAVFEKAVRLANAALREAKLPKAKRSDVKRLAPRQPHCNPIFDCLAPALSRKKG